MNRTGFPLRIIHIREIRKLSDWRLIFVKKNILYIHTHDSGRYLEPYGCNVSTPHIMQLAMEGTLFRSAFCAAPT